MTTLNEYLQDGANRQARAVMAMVQGFNVEESWNPEFHCYKAEPKIARWQNCREQGYIITLRTPKNTLQLAFFEHRNSDSICALRWEQNATNSPTIETADFGGACYATKHDVSFEVSYGKIVEMAEWLQDQITKFWNDNQPKP